MLSQSLTANAKTVTRSWGWFLAAGVAWIVFAFIVLSFNYRTVWAIAVFFGIGFIIGGIMEFAVAADRAEVAPHPPRHRVDHCRAVRAHLARRDVPGPRRHRGLAAPLLRHHRHRVAFSTRDMGNLWWMQLIAGIIMVAIGFWALSPDDATMSSYLGVVLLVVWIGAAALIRGISDIVVGFRLHSANKRLESLPPP